MINEQIPEFDETQIAEEGQPKSVFRSNASTMWKTIVNIAKSLNRFRTQVNQTQDEINIKHTDVSNMFNTFKQNSGEDGGYSQAAIDDMFNDIPNKFNRNLFVNQTNGLDSNSGASPSDAFNSIQKAVDCVPIGGRANIRILGDYVLEQDVVCPPCQLMFSIGADGGTFKTKWRAISATTSSLNRFLLQGTHISWSINTYENTQTDKSYFHIPKNDTGLPSNSYQNYFFVPNPYYENNSVTFIFRIRNDEHIGLELEEGYLIRSNPSTGDKSDISLSMSGYYRGELKISTNTCLLYFIGTATFNYGFSGVSVVDENGDSVSVQDKVIGVIKDTNGVPRNIKSNIIF